MMFVRLWRMHRGQNRMGLVIGGFKGGPQGERYVEKGRKRRRDARSEETVRAEVNREDEARAKAECVRKLSLHRISKAKHTYDGSAVANSSDGEAGREDGSRGGGDGSTSRETEGSTRARLVTKEVTSSHQPSQRETIPTNNSASLTLQPLIHRDEQIT